MPHAANPTRILHRQMTHALPVAGSGEGIHLIDAQGCRCIDASGGAAGCRPLQRSVALADIAQLKRIRVRGLEWLITPRLLLRSRSSGKSNWPMA